MNSRKNFLVLTFLIGVMITTNIPLTQAGGGYPYIPPCDYHLFDIGFHPLTGEAYVVMQEHSTSDYIVKRCADIYAISPVWIIDLTVPYDRLDEQLLCQISVSAKAVVVCGAHVWIKYAGVWTDHTPDLLTAMGYSSLTSMSITPGFERAVKSVEEYSDIATTIRPFTPVDERMMAMFPEAEVYKKCKVIDSLDFGMLMCGGPRVFSAILATGDHVLATHMPGYVFSFDLTTSRWAHIQLPKEPEDLSNPSAIPPTLNVLCEIEGAIYGTTYKKRYMIDVNLVWDRKETIGRSVLAFHGSSLTNMWLFQEEGYSPSVRQTKWFDGTDWQPESCGDCVNYGLWRLLAVDASEVYGIHPEYILSWNGIEWKTDYAPAWGAPNLRSIAIDPSTGIPIAIDTCKLWMKIGRWIPLKALPKKLAGPSTTL